MTNTSVHYIELLSLREIPLEKNVGFQMQIHEKTASGEPSKIQFVLNHLKIDLFLKPLSLMMWQKDSIVWLKYKAPGHKQSPFKRYELEFNSEFDCELCISLLERLGVPPPKRLTSKPSTTASSNKTAANRFPISTQQESQVKNLWSQPMPPPLETLFCSQQHSYSVDPIPAWSDSLVNSLDSATAPPAKLGSSQLFVDSQHVPDLDSQKLATLKQTNPQSNSQSFQSLNTLVFASSQKRSVGSGAQVETALKKAKLDFSFESDHDYIMEKVIEKRRVEGQVQYKIKWKGFPEDHCTWKFYSPTWTLEEIGKALEFEKSLVLVDDDSQPHVLDNSLDHQDIPLDHQDIPFVFDIDSISNAQLLSWVESQTKSNTQIQWLVQNLDEQQCRQIIQNL